MRDVLTTARRIGLAYVVASAQVNLGPVLLQRGRAQEALAMARAGVEAFKTQNDPRTEGVARIYLTGILAATGELERAEIEARAALALLETVPGLRPEGLAMLAHVLLVRGRGEEALVAASDAMTELEARSSMLEEGESLVRLSFARALDAAGDRAAAQRVIAKARDRLRERAAQIAREDWRRTFLENVPEHARTLALAAEWLGD